MSAVTVSITYKSLDEIVENIMKACINQLEFTAVISRELDTVTFKCIEEMDPVKTEAFNSVIISVILDNIGLLNFKDFNKIIMLLDDRRHLIIRRYKDYYFTCITKPGSKLGFIELILEYYLSENSMEL